MCICQMNIKHLTKHKVTLNSGGWQIQNKLHIFFFSQYNQLSVSKSIGLQEEYTINKLANQNTLILYVWFVKKKTARILPTLSQKIKQVSMYTASLFLQG